MYHPSLNEFLKLSKKGNVIPVYKEINADLDTPVSAFLKIKKDAYAFLLESVEGQERIARYSFLGSNPALIFLSKGKHIQIIDRQKKQNLRFITKTDPLDEIKKIMRDFQAVQIKGLPRFWGGMAGYIGYDMVRFFERLPDKNPDDLKLPDAIFILTDTLLIFDHANHTVKIVSNVLLPSKVRNLSATGLKRFYRQALAKIEAIHSQLSRPHAEKRKTETLRRKRLITVSNIKKQEFIRMVKRAKEFIRAGDIIQTVLSQRFKVKIGGTPFDIYRTLRSSNPSPYMYFLELKDLFLIGSSPEMLVRSEERQIETRPIAGTRPRGKTEDQDQALAEELLHDEKERAEHIMLVDLGRNDLGRVSKTGKVAISEFMNVEKYSHVMHLVTEVSGVLDKQYDIYDLLRATFPAGTVTGSPKVRAMEIIEELETLRRGPYAGAVGYFSFSHNLDTCITIRTIVLKGNTAYIQAGAGIVADSVPEKEYQETVNKARALIEAIHPALARKGWVH